MKRKRALNAIAMAAAAGMIFASSMPVMAATVPAAQTLTVNAVDGATYNVYKIAAVTDTIGSGETGTFTYAIDSAFSGFFGKDGAANGNTDGFKLNEYNEIQTADGTNVVTQGLTYDKGTYSTSENAAKLAADLEKWVQAKKVTSVATITGAKKTASLPAGYYLVSETATTKDASGHIASKPVLVRLVPNGTNTVTPKADTITLTKVIVGGQKAGKISTASEKDTISYKVTSAVPTYPANVDTTKLTYQFVDTLGAGLTGKADSVVVKAGDAALDNNTDYTVNYTGQKLTVALKPAAIAAHQGQTVELTYSASVNNKAVTDSAAGNPNSVDLTFTNNVNIAQTDDLLDTAKVYSYAIKLVKKDVKNTGLKGAKFEVKDAKGTLVGTYTTGDDGTVEVPRLNVGTYTITETEAPSGFAKLTKPITLTIKDNDLDGKGTFTCATDDTVAQATIGGVTDGTENGNGVTDVTLTIKNNKGITLPETGSTAARNLSVAGSVGLAGGILFIAVSARKKKN